VGKTAADVVNQADEAELVRIFFEYGEERYSRRIVRRIIAQRKESELLSTGELAQLVREAVPGGQRPSKIHPATRVFQALRIYVNDELGQLKRGLEVGISLLKPGGRRYQFSFIGRQDCETFISRKGQRVYLSTPFANLPV
jgi:16S rRNA (cytosine1402-N4)-methyltransferase